MTRFVYSGPSLQLGRFGPVNQGDVLALTDAEVASVVGNARFAREPASSTLVILEKNDDYTLLSGDSGKLLRSKHSAPVTYTLPTSPSGGFSIEIEDASIDGASANTITIEPGSNEIDGIETPEITVDRARLSLYWNGAVWKTFKLPSETPISPAPAQDGSGGGGGGDTLPYDPDLSHGIGFFTYGEIGIGTDWIFLEGTAKAGYDIESTTTVQSMSWPNLVSIDIGNAQAGGLTLNDNSALVTVDVSSLEYVAGNFAFIACPLLESLSAQALMHSGDLIIQDSGITSIDLSAYETCGGNFSISGNASLNSLDISSLQTVTSSFTFQGNTLVTSLSSTLQTAIQIFISNNTLLASVTLDSLVTATFGISAINNPALVDLSLAAFVPTDGATLFMTGNAFSAASVNALLARCIANPAFVSGTVNLSGGTSEAPTGQGITDAADLITRGVSVTTN